MSNTETPSSIEATVGIVCFNTPLATLERALVSLKNSSIDPEIIVLCNSPSKTYQGAVASLCQTFGVRALLHEENRGFGAGHNRIFSEARGTWYICCNPDVRVNADSIRLLIDASVSLANPVLLMPKVLGSDGEIQKLCRKSLTLFNWIHRNLWHFLPSLPPPYEQGFEYSKTQSVEFVSGCFFAVKSDTYRELRGFSDDFFLYCEDADLSRRALNIGQNYYISEAVIYHEWVKQSSRSLKAFRLHIKSLITYFLKHGLA